MKVKIFSSDRIDPLETEIDDFVKDKKVIDIKFQSLAVPTQYNNFGQISSIGIFDRVLIMYEEGESNEP